jgi:hypothetical protein
MNSNSSKISEENCTTTNNSFRISEENCMNSNRSFYYLHHIIMDVQDENLSDFTKTVDHINRNKLDNRKENLRLVNMSVQNSNRDKPSRRSDAIDLPEGINQSDLPKYIVYRKEILNKETGRYREYFYICNHPKLKRWETTKSNKISITDKLKLAINKLNKLNLLSDNESDQDIDKDSESDQDVDKDFNLETKSIFTSLTQLKLDLDLPIHISLLKIRNKDHFVYDYKQNDIRYNLKMIIKSNNIKNELKIFIDKINEKYPQLKLINNISIISFENSKTPSVSCIEEEYFINNSDNINTNTPIIKKFNSNIETLLIEETNSNTINIINTLLTEENKSNDIKLKLPQNFSFYKEKNTYYFAYSKNINKIRINKKISLTSNDIQSEFNKLVKILNDTYSDLIIDDYMIPDIQKNISIITKNQNIETNIKPILPKKFSIPTINNIDYIQFSKKINENKYQYKTKINSYNLQEELNKFIDSLNTNYSLNLNKNDYIINNTNWKTTNKIVDHNNPTDKQLKDRERTLKCLNKKKELLGEEEFKKQKNDYMKLYNHTKKLI